MSKVNVIKFLDKYLGRLICLILSFFRIFYSKKEIEINKILIIQLWGIGESILTLPAISGLRKKFPKANIDILLTDRNKDVYYNNKDINKQISLKLNPFSIKLFILKNFRKYDLVIDMEEYLNISSIISFFIGKKRIGFFHNIRSKLYTDTIKFNDHQHNSQTFADLLKPIKLNYKVKNLIKLNYSQKDKKFINNLLKNKINKNDFIVGIAPGAAESARSRMWPLKNYIQLSNELIKKYKNIKIIFIGNNKEKCLIEDIIKKINEKSKIINFAGKTTLRQLFYLTEKLNLMVSNDAGAMHIAAAQSTKTIGLFGPNLPIRFGPLNNKSFSIYKGEICKYSPCINVHKGQVPECFYQEKDYQKCMKNIKVEDVLKLVKF
ncbi:glycosyltransferase family 9 protein [Candidatus Pacearchaeota archaeon]|nr:glycosyltransferase family 9 protein [Candidatus Pacearchaeota archaeon]